MIALSAFADEIDQDLAVQIRELRKEEIKHIEFRAAWGKNVLDLSDEEVDRARQMMDDAMVRVAAIGSPIGKIKINDDWQAHVARFKRALAVAQRFEAPYIRIFSFYGPDGRCPDEARDEVLRRMQELVRLAEEAGQVLCHENEAQIYGDTPERCADLLETIDSPFLRGIFDPANYIMEGLRPFDQCWPLMRDHTEYFHIKDGSLSQRKVMAAGDGDGQIEETLRDALARGFDGFCSLEPHLRHAGKMYGETGPDLFHVAAKKFKAVVERAGGRWRPVRAAIVGCGMISRFHIEAITKTRDAIAVGVMDTSGECAESAGAKHDLPAFTEVGKLLRKTKPDFITVATPSGAHAKAAQAALRKGIHVLCEKPLEITTQRCDRLIAEADKAGAKLGVVFQSRYVPQLVKVKQLIDEGRLGKVLVANAYTRWFRPQSYYDRGGWRGTWEMDGGGALMNQSIHYVDLLLWLAGDVEWVSAQTGTLRHKIETEDHAAATLRFKSGAIGTLIASTAMWPGFDRSVEIAGEKGTVIIRDDYVPFCRIEGEDAPPEGIESTPPAETAAADPAAGLRGRHVPVFQEFVSAILENRMPTCDGREGRRSVELICAVYKSAKLGRAVRV